MKKRWVQTSVLDQEKVTDLMNALQIDPVLATILVNRQVTNFEEARNFFRPDIEHLHDPFLMKDMDKAISRIELAITNGEKIMIYGDYDVDGTTSVSLVYGFFSERYHNLIYYIPNRYSEGYGISSQGIDFAEQEGISLIIALDCGIKSVDKVAYANKKNIDFIICDHHLPGEEIPQAIAVLDPKRNDCHYPYKELSGCGIGFKLVQAFADKNNLPQDTFLKYLDLVAVSIASDIVPITGENRTLAYFGLKKLNENPCVGLKALMGIACKEKDLTITDVVFTIGPRINAAGRIDDAKDAVKLLICDEHDDALSHSALINLKNTERKGHDAQITEEALAIIDASEALINRKTTVLYQENWHKGVIGIVASRLTEKYYRPTVILTRSNGLLTGSARSVAGYDLYEALYECRDLLEQFGGHKYAAGLTIKPENIDAFSTLFEAVVSKNITEDLLTQEINIDAELRLNHLTPKFVRILNQFEPFGPQNLSPVFIAKGVDLAGTAMQVGKNHLKFAVSQNGSAVFNCIGFGLADDIEKINSKQKFDICFHIEENVWRDQKSVQLNIKGIRIV